MHGNQITHASLPAVAAAAKILNASQATKWEGGRLAEVDNADNVQPRINWQL